MKKWMLLLLCILLAMGSADAAVSARMEESAALLGADGSVIIAPGEFDDIVPLGSDLFAAGREGMYALMDSEGNCITEAAFSQIRIREGLILAEKGGHWGILNADGTPRSEFLYTLIVPDASRNCWALKDDPNDLESDKLYRIDPDGEARATRIYVRGMHHAAGEGLLGVLLPGSGLYGYCDALGRLRIEAQYEYAGSFTNGLAAVVVNGKYGAIDRDGALVIPAEYDFLEISEAGFVIAAKNLEGAYVFSMDGSEAARFEGEEYYIALVGDGYAVVDGQFLSVYGADGGMLLEAPAASVVLEGVDGQLIISEGMWGEECVYLNGSDTRYQNLYPLGSVDGEAIYACMEANVGRYMNDLLGEIQLSTDMDSARYGVVNGRGEKLLDCAYLSISYIGEGRLLARTEAQWQMIDVAGRVYWSCDAPMQTEESSF